jgi:outer membrane protein assembly factor BamE
MRKLIYLLVLVSSLTLSSCSSILNNLPGVYSLDVQQGNIIDQGMIDQLRPKMTKRQVLYIMGSSMLTDVFHQKRWDYLYSEQPSGKPRRQKRLSLFFDGDELIGIQGDFRPSTLPIIKESNETSIEVPKRDLDKTLWEKITGLFSDDEEATISESEPEQDPQSNETASDIETEDSEETENIVDNSNADTTEDASAPSTETVDESLDTLKEEVQESTDISIKPLEEEKPQELEEIQNE